eukprot:1663801-Ditylum_brightwellii.AAC.1
MILFSTGWSEKIPSPVDEPMFMNLKELCVNGLVSRTWVKNAMRFTDNGDYVADAICNVTAIAISNWSFKDGISMVAATIQGPLYTYKSISGTCVSPGPEEEQDPYLGELSGLYAIVFTVELVCMSHNINKSRIKRAIDADTTHSCRSAHFSIISAIHQKVRTSPLEWYWQQIKGHQNNHMEPLNKQATINVEMDMLAKARHSQETQSMGTRYLGVIEGEMWQ